MIDASNAGERRPPDATSKLGPAALAERAAALVAQDGARHAAEVLGLSVSHVRNLARLRRALAPQAWAVFAAEGPAASLSWWLALAALPAPEQLTRLGRRRARPRRRSNRLLEQKRRAMAPNDLRARVIGWVLGLEDFPRATCGACARMGRLSEIAPKRLPSFLPVLAARPARLPFEPPKRLEGERDAR